MMVGAVLTVGAQTIKTNFKKGDVFNYNDAMNMKMELPMGQGTQTVDVTKKVVIEIVDKTKDGYKIALTNSGVTIKGDEMASDQALSGAMKYLNDVKIVFKTDANAVIQGIDNYEEVVTAASNNALKTIDELYTKNPMIEQALPKAKMIMAVSQLLEEKELIKTLQEETHFFLYGKKIKTGDKENRSLAQGIKAVSTYTIGENAGNTTISVASVSNMTEEDVKAMIVEQMKKMGMGDEAASNLEAGWEQMKGMGMTNIDFKGNETYVFQPNGALVSTNSKSDVKVMGMNITMTRNVEVAP